jgi:hypothetical protein
MLSAGVRIVSPLAGLILNKPGGRGGLGNGVRFMR